LKSKKSKRTRSREGRDSARRSAVAKLVILFFASGATSLVYETLWARHLNAVIGTSQLAICTVLSAFMGGLAIGAFAAARWGQHIRRPLLAYAALEAFIGAYALVFPWMIKLATPGYLAISAQLPAGSLLLPLGQLLLLGAILLPPTIGMGATLPLLARLASPKGDGTGFQVGRLYGANTLGAVVGTAFAGFFLLPRLGIAATTYWAAGCNGALAIAALLLSRSMRVRATAQSQSSSQCEVAAPSDSSFRIPILIAGLAGFASLLCEVAWFRLLTLLFGGSAYSFTIMLLAFLSGIGIGGWVGGRAADRSFEKGGRATVLRHLSGIQIGVALLCWVSMFAYSEMPLAMIKLYDWTENTPTLLFPAQIGVAMTLMLAPALLMGATFPYVVTSVSRGDSRLERSVGLIYGANTIGSILGASLGGLVLLSSLGVLGSVMTAAGANGLAALLAASAAMRLADGETRNTPRFAGLVMAAVAAFGLMVWLRPPWDPLLMTAGVYRYADNVEDKTRDGVLDYFVRPFDLLYYKEGLSSVVTVGLEREDGNIWLANNGKVDASSQSDLDTQVMLAQLASFSHPDPKNALVIGLASGVTAGSLLLDDRIEKLAIVEIEFATIAASHFFDEVNNKPLDDPRSQMIVDDARSFLLRTPDHTYDIVISEPSNPWLTGVSNLFTREFFELGKRKLARNGIWSQWVQTYGMPTDDLLSLLATFADVYPTVQVFRLNEQDLVLIGSPSPLELRTRSIYEYCSTRPKILAELARINIRGAEGVVGMYAFDRDAILKIAKDIELNTDDNMRIEYSAPLHLNEDTTEANNLLIESQSVIPAFAVTPGGLLALTRFYASHDIYWNRTLEAIRLTARTHPDNAEVQFTLQQYERQTASKKVFEIR
jgi:predicted membrane-bound spermidine synthase